MAGNTCIPLELAAAVQNARPKCPYYLSGPWGCRKGAKCPLRHSDEIASGVHLAHVTRMVGEDGLSSIVLRPPLTAALVKYFKDLNLEVPLTQGELWQLNSVANETGCETSVITFRLVHMVEPDLAVIGQAKVQNGVMIDGAWHGSTSKVAPFLVHGTTCKLALAALADGYLRASPGVGKCGDGIYGFAIPDANRSNLALGWDRTVAGGYNGGAMFCMCTQNVPVVKTKSGSVVPTGCLSNQGDQFAAGPRTAVYHSITFSIDCLVGMLSDNLMANGYGPRLHAALRSVQDYLHDQREASSSGAAPSARAPTESICILNQAVVPPKVGLLLAPRQPLHPPPPPPPKQQYHNEPEQPVPQRQQQWNPQQLPQAPKCDKEPSVEELLGTQTVMDVMKSVRFGTAEFSGEVESESQKAGDDDWGTWQPSDALQSTTGAQWTHRPPVATSSSSSSGRANLRYAPYQ